MAKRRTIPNALKLQIIKAYLKGKASVSELANKHAVQPSQIYSWEKQLFDNGGRSFERKNCRATGEGAARRADKAIEDLKSMLADKDSVISTLTEELLKEKKLAGILSNRNT